MSSKITLKSKLLLNKKFSDQFGVNFSFTIMGICHLFPLVYFFYSYLPLSTLFSNQKVFFQKQYTASAIRSKMTLVNVVPQVVPDPKTGVSGMGTFVGGSTPFPAPCVQEEICYINKP